MYASKTQSVRNLALFFGIYRAVSTVAQEPIHFEDIAMASYHLTCESYTSAIVPEGVNIEDLDWMDRERLTPIHIKQKLSFGVDQNYSPLFEERSIIHSQVEEWMESADQVILSSNGSVGYDEYGEQMFHFKLNKVEKQDLMDLQKEYTDNGFTPIMRNFPTIDGEEVQQYINEGAVVQELENGQFLVSWKYRDMLIDPVGLYTIEKYMNGSDQVELRIYYTYFAPYGYVKTWEHEERYRLDTDVPVTLIKKTKYTDHKVVDDGNIIPRSGKDRFIAILPNPVEDEFWIQLNGIDDSEVLNLQIRDHMGNVVFESADVHFEDQHARLNASTYPEGILLAIIITEDGTSSASFIKVQN